MTKKQLRYAFNSVIEAASKISCEDLYHRQVDMHEHDAVCPVEYRLSKQIHIVQEYMRGNDI